MIYEKIHLKKYYSKLKYDPILEIMSPEVNPSLSGNIPSPIWPLMLIVPGGAYLYCSQREMDPVAFSYMKMGFATAIIKYTCKSDIKKSDLLYPHPQLEVVAAIDYLRNHAKKFRFNVNKVGLVGFSAGGHLVASVGAYYDKYAKTLGLNAKNVKPNAIVLSYSITDFYDVCGSRLNLINEENLYVDTLSIVKHVSKNYPPTFLWCTNDDKVVPSYNSKNMAKELKKHNVPHQLVVFPTGPHGLSTHDVTTNVTLTKEDINKSIAVKAWVEMSVKFLNKIYKNVKN